MGLLDKVRILVGALMHKPFTPRPEKVNVDGPAKPPADRSVHHDGAALKAPEAGIEDTERVADLLAQQRREDAA
jgi:hypothetical protein